MGPELETEFHVREEITLRTFNLSDADTVYDAVDRNRDHLQTFMHWMTPEYSRESAREFVGRAVVRREAE